MTKPGLRKARGPALVDVRTRTRVRAVDARWREAFEAADVMSEGAAVDEPHPSGGRVWYGSTSIILAWPPDAPTGEDRAFLAAVAERDAHVRTRALRLAVREAGSRAPHDPGPHDPGERGGRLGRTQCEITFSTCPQGLRIDVDVQAPLIEGSRVRGART